MKDIKTDWNLNQLYKSPEDPQIEKDILVAEKAYKSFAKKYSSTKKYLTNENALFIALKDYEKLAEIPVSKTMFYLHLAQDLDSKNEMVRAKSNLLSQRLQKMENLIIFFGINISKIDEKKKKKFLTSKKLAHFKYLLKNHFDSGKYVLTESEEKILSLKSLPSHSLWTEMVSKMKSKQTLEYKGKNIPIAEAESMVKELSTKKEIVDLQNKIMEKYFALADVAEGELNAIVIDKKISDELRGFKEPYDATILGYENERKTVMNLVKTVTDNFSVAHRFFEVKAKMLKVSKLFYADRGASVGKLRTKVSFDESYNILQKLFDSLDPKFGEILKGFVANGQIDAFPKVGKTGGAYCSHNYKSPTFVLLNHTDSLNSLSTFAHEMGHAIHSEFSKSQPAIYEGYSTSTAEVASTLFESFLFYDRFEKMTKEEKIIALHDKIQDDVSTIFRQVACFNFEEEMHKTIKEKGNMPKEEFASVMNKHMKSYIGKVEFAEKDGYFFVGWSHLRYFFYVYSYAFGQIVSKALYKKYQEDKTYIEKIKKFLSAGGSMSPEDIFKSIGIDLTKPDFFKKGIETIEEDIELLKKLVGNR